ncbi:uncharacterized protein AKAW2_70145A [Aspergillus luchuensis]|uniref:Uncharacterized protein n=1 Tax=Aspergillus kawachii TaxID=1069201 RepID=A0A7R8A363_ASPKA|nr:uncharacterized protein AKAW2_70145A [Aspergillus luchuensis]BCS03267.1 hypothetical protein AKAW2_70145A [Aspergillus luchuensis]
MVRSPCRNVSDSPSTCLSVPENRYRSTQDTSPRLESSPPPPSCHFRQHGLPYLLDSLRSRSTTRKVRMSGGLSSRMTHQFEDRILFSLSDVFRTIAGHPLPLGFLLNRNPIYSTKATVLSGPERFLTDGSYPGKAASFQRVPTP